MKKIFYLFAFSILINTEKTYCRKAGKTPEISKEEQKQNYFSNIRSIPHNDALRKSELKASEMKANKNNKEDSREEVLTGEYSVQNLAEIQVLFNSTHLFPVVKDEEIQKYLDLFEREKIMKFLANQFEIIFSQRDYNNAVREAENMPATGRNWLLQKNIINSYNTEMNKITSNLLKLAPNLEAFKNSTKVELMKKDRNIIFDKDSLIKLIHWTLVSYTADAKFKASNSQAYYQSLVAKKMLIIICEILEIDYKKIEKVIKKKIQTNPKKISSLTKNLIKASTGILAAGLTYYGYKNRNPIKNYAKEYTDKAIKSGGEIINSTINAGKKSFKTIKNKFTKNNPS